MTDGGTGVRTPQEIAARANERLRGTFADLLGMQFTHLAPDRVEATLQVRQELKQSRGIIHGGAVMALADSVAGSGSYLNVAGRQQTVTVELKINLIGAVREGKITAVAVPVHRGRTTSVWETRVTDEAGKLIAVALSTHLVLDRPTTRENH